MKQFSHLMLFGLLSLIVAFSACKKDDEIAGLQNQFTFNGERYQLTKGFIENYGINSATDSYDWDVILTSSEIEYTSGSQSFTGIGDIIYLDLNTSSSTGLVSGTYTFSSIRNEFTLVDGRVVTGGDLESGNGNYADATGGTVEVTVNGTEVHLTFSLATPAGAVSGTYRGSLTEI